MANPTDNPNRPSYKERMARKRLAGWLKFYLAAIVLGGLCGYAFLKRTELQALYEQYVAAPTPQPAAPAIKETDKKVADAPVPIPVPAVKPPPVVPPVVEAPKAVPKPVVLPQDQLRARKLIDEGKWLVNSELDFDAAGQSFEAAAALKAEPETLQEAQTWARKALEFAHATAHMHTAEFAVSENAVVIETIDGSEWQGLKQRDDGEKLYLQAVPESNPASEGKQIFPIPKNEIRKVTPLSRSARQANFAQVLLATEGASTITSGADAYDLVYLSKRLGMAKECAAYLNRAFDGGNGHAADPHLGDSFRQVVIRRALSRATLLMAANRVTLTELELKKLQQTLPNYPPLDQELAAFRSQVMAKVTPDYKSTITLSESKPIAAAPKRADAPAAKPRAEESKIEVAADNSGVKGNGAAAAIVEKGNQKFTEGLTTIRRYVPGVGGNKDENNRVLTAARQSLNEAIDIYEEALKLDPGNRAILNRQKEASVLVYFCVKNFIFG
jgi:tetratricopeptide (TPR) repeat protein